MYESQHRPVRSRKAGGIFRRLLLILGALVAFFRDAVRDDVTTALRNWRLFAGTALTAVGALSFASDRYCDGNASQYAACTRPATYYFYPWWAVVLIILGISLIVLWRLRLKQSL